ncbi:MAG: F-box protein, partial [Myxococcota bacterium]
MKLNEAIEKLSIAISLAGTQSSQRLQHFTNSQTVAILKECVVTAETAKKWERPSFVGSAATLIQGLNSQCEALLREIQTLRKQQSSGVQPMVTSFSAGTKRSSEEAKQGDVSGGKRARTVPLSTINYESALRQDKIWSTTTSYLDPASLVRCRRVCKTWKKSLSLHDHLHWLQMGIYRFGMVAMRQWKEHYEGCSALDLYKKMDAANVRPKGTIDNGAIVLGHGRIPGKASAWALLMERSNGETMRSVKKKDGSGYSPHPVVELRIVIQNIGEDVLEFRPQRFSV